MSKTIHDCNTCEISRVCGKHENGGCDVCKYFASVTKNNLNFGKICVCTACLTNKDRPLWRQRKDF